jgi:transcriptional regulator with XRE-family HTH domain
VPSLDPVPEDVVARREAIGLRIRAARRAAGLTQDKLGERVDLTRVTISNIERGRNAALLDSLIRISDVVDVPLRDLVDVGAPLPQ